MIRKYWEGKGNTK